MKTAARVHDLKGLHTIVDEAINRVIDTKAAKTQHSLTEDILLVFHTLITDFYPHILRRDLTHADKYFISDLSGRLLKTTEGKFPQRRVKNLIMYLNDPGIDQEFGSRYREFTRFHGLCYTQKLKGIVECCEKDLMMENCGSKFIGTEIRVVSCTYERHLSPLFRYIAK